MSRHIALIAITLLVSVVFSMTVVCAANRGPAQIEIFGGGQGKVPFPHAAHQDSLKDCKICHNVFPQETDSIKTLKEQGVLKKKKVMNLQCIKCHKQERKAGKPHGPVTCTTCHIK